MSANNHTPIATGAEAAAQIINAPLGQLDASLGDLDSLDTVAKTDLVSALNELNTKKQNNFTSQSAGQVLASPTTTSGSPGFRALVSTDLPNSTVSAGTYTKVTCSNKGIITAGTNLSVSDISDISTLPVDTLGATTDVTTNNVTIAKHGFMPKLINDAQQIINGLGAWVKWAMGIKYNGSGYYTPRGGINFKGAGVVVQDNVAGDCIDVTISGIAGGNQSLSTLTDTSISSPANNQVLAFDYSSQTWINQSIQSFIPTGHVVSASGVNLTNRPTLNFTGTAVNAVDNSSNNRTDVVIDLPAYASGSTAGLVALVTGSQVTAGISGSMVISPSALAHSDYGKRGVQLTLNGSIALTTNDKAYFRIPSIIDGWNLVAVNASCSGSSTSGSPVFTVKSGSQTMLSTDLKINEGAYDSTAGTINTSYDDVHTGNRIEVACSTAGTGVTYSIVDLVFQLP